MDGVEHTRFWQAPAVSGVELLQARYIGQTFTPHVHEGHVIALIEAGAERYRYRGEEHLAPAGSLALLNPDEVHTGSSGHADGWRYRVFYPEMAGTQSLLAELELAPGAMPAFSTSVVQDPSLYRVFAQLHRLLAGHASDLEQQTAWREAMLQLFQRHTRIARPTLPGNEPLAVRRAKEWLASRLAEPPSLEQLAAHVGLSPFHFARVFRRATGMPPHAWLQQRRVEQARALLKDGQLPVDVALGLGFADQSHLTRQFKRVYGVGPGAYRDACARSFKIAPG